MRKGIPPFGTAFLTFAALFSSPLGTAAAPPLSQPGTITTVVGSGKQGFSEDGAAATQAAFTWPYNLVVDRDGNLLFTETFNYRVRKVSPDGTLSTVAGGGTTAPKSASGSPATQAHLGALTGLVLDPDGNLFIGDNDNYRIWRVRLDGVITAVAGNGKSGFSGDRGLATNASLEGPDGLVVDGGGNLYFSDNWNNRVRVVHPDGTIALVAGGGKPADGLGDGGPANQARLNLPVHLALDKNGNLFISDFLSNRVRMVRPDGVILTAVGGGNPADGLGDGGPATQARLEGPAGLAVDGAGNLFVADNRHFRVRKVDPAGIITTVAGTGQAGFSGDGGPATEAMLNAPESLAIDRAGNLFIADTIWLSPVGHSGSLRNNRVREVFGVAVPG